MSWDGSWEGERAQEDDGEGLTRGRRRREGGGKAEGAGWGRGVYIDWVGGEEGRMT